MTALTFLGISEAFAATGASNPQAGGLASFLPMMLVFVIGAYFLMIRPQNKRVKAHRKLLAELAKGDEVITVGGIIGRVSKINDDFITLTVADNVELNVQKSAISNVLPKGTFKNVTVNAEK